MELAAAMNSALLKTFFAWALLESLNGLTENIEARIKFGRTGRLCSRPFHKTVSHARKSSSCRSSSSKPMMCTVYLENRVISVTRTYIRRIKVPKKGAIAQQRSLSLA